MTIRFQHVGTLVEIFNADDAAQAAIQQLKATGFKESQIVVAIHDGEIPDDAEIGTEIGERATAGVAAGLGVGTRWGLAILAGIVPGIGPAVVGGTIGVLLSSAAVAAATAGTAGALIGLKVSHEEIGNELGGGHPRFKIVTVKAGPRADIADEVLTKFKRSDRISTQAM